MGSSETNIYKTVLTPQSYVNGSLVNNTLPTISVPILVIDQTEETTIDGSVISTKTYHVFVSNYEYEYELNEQKRRVRIPKVESISSIENEFSRLVS
jgi:carbamoylphosphate synthase small subunit